MIISSILYYLIIHIINKIDFDKYNDRYRIYAHYIFLCLLCLLYWFELFVIEGSKRIVTVNIKSMIRSPSFDFEIESMQDDTMDALKNESKNHLNVSGIISSLCNKDREKDKNKLESDINDKSISIYPNTNDILSKYGSYNITNPNEKIESVIQIFPDFKPTLKNADKYYV